MADWSMWCSWMVPHAPSPTTLILMFDDALELAANRKCWASFDASLSPTKRCKSRLNSQIIAAVPLRFARMGYLFPETNKVLSPGWYRRNAALFGMDCWTRQNALNCVTLRLHQDGG